MKVLTSFLALLLIGYASQYAPTVAERTIRVRQTQPVTYPLGAIPNVDGYAVTQECKDVGSIILLRPHGWETWETFWVIDCASKTSGSPRPGESSHQWMKRGYRNLEILVEVDYQTAVRWQTVGRLKLIDMQPLPTGME